MAQKKKETGHTPSEELQRLPFPAYQLNEKGIFLSRNKAGNPRIFPIRMRAMIDRYLSSADQKRIEALQIGEEVQVDIQLLDTHGAIVYRCADGYWVALRALITRLMTYVQQSGSESPSFFPSIDAQSCSLRAVEEQFPDDLHILRDNFRHMIRYHTEIAMYLQYTADKQEKGDVCEVTAPLNSLLARAEKLLRPNGFRPEMQSAAGPIYVRGEANEIRYAVALMIACAAEHLRDKRHLSIHGKVLEEEFFFNVLFEPLPEGALYRTILSGKYEEGLSSAFGTLFFQLLLLRKMADARGWRFSVVNAGNRDGFLRMTLALPVTEQCPLLLSETSDPLPLIKTMLSFLLPPEDEE